MIYFFSNFRGADKTIIETEIVGNDPQLLQIFLGKDKDLEKWFQVDQLPAEVTEYRGFAFFDIFNKRAFGDGRPRKYDSELKFIFDFLLNNWNKSDLFRVKNEATKKIGLKTTKPQV